MFCTFPLALSSMCAKPNMAVFCSSLSSCFRGLLLRYCLSDLEMVSVTPVITGIIFALTFHMHRDSVMRYLYFKIFSASLLTTFLSPGIAVSITVHVPCLIAWIMTSSLSLGCCYYYYTICMSPVIIIIIIINAVVVL